MSVHLKKDGRWIVQYRDKSTQKLKTEYFGRDLEGEARARERQKELGLNPWKRRTPKRKSPYFIELVNGYMTARFGTIEPVSLKNFQYKMTGIILPEIGQTQAVNLTPHRMDQYVGKRLRSVKRTTVHREISDIQAVLNWAVSRKYITHNPLAGYQKPKRDDEIILPPSAAEAERILINAPDHLVRAISISYYTGIRPGRAELLSLKWTDVDFTTDTILIRSAKKGGLRYRIVPIHKNLKIDLDTWRQQDLDLTTDHIIHFHGKPIGSIKTAFGLAKKKAGITRRLRLYDFRHAFASYMLQGNADLKSTSEILGHTRTDTTTRIYQHTDIKMHREAIDRLPGLNTDHTKVWSNKKAVKPHETGD